MATPFDPQLFSPIITYPDPEQITVSQFLQRTLMLFEHDAIQMLIGVNFSC
jgi:hypothetical protein